jgi:hypothetical protein
MWVKQCFFGLLEVLSNGIEPDCLKIWQFNGVKPNFQNKIRPEVPILVVPEWKNLRNRAF